MDALSALEGLLGEGTEGLTLLVWILPVVVLVLYGQRIQLLVTSREIGRAISRMEGMRDSARAELEGAAAAAGCRDAARLGLLVGQFAVQPVSMDPAGMVARVRHLVRSREGHVRSLLLSMAPGAGEEWASRAAGMVEIAAALHLLHRTVSHMYLTARRQRNYPLILPLQMALPGVMEEARALRAAAPAFRAGKPIGDGIGPVVVGRMMAGLAHEEAAHETLAAEASVEGRTVRLVKARGPLCTTGRPGDAVDALVSRHGRPDAIITVDAAVRLEGEETGQVAAGYGVAMGGSGAARHQVEEAAARAGAPALAVVVKQTVEESLTMMDRRVASQAGRAAELVRGALLESVPEGGSAIVVGVGNTMGVAQ